MIIIISSCKKAPYYPVSDEMKEWFSFQKGSYWIYKDDSTGTLDSAYVTANNDFIYDYQDYSKTTWQAEWVITDFNSKFLYNFKIQYVNCEGSNFFTVGSHLQNLPPGQTEDGGDLGYFPGWPSNTKIIPNCWKGDVFFYRNILADTINNISYSNLLYAENQRVDSALTNPYYYLRKMYFVKHVGIVKYYEVSKQFNIKRSYSLLRYKVYQ
jgi:hypothetical protein